MAGASVSVGIGAFGVSPALAAEGEDGTETIGVSRGGVAGGGSVGGVGRAPRQPASRGPRRDAKARPALGCIGFLRRAMESHEGQALLSEAAVETRVVRLDRFTCAFPAGVFSTLAPALHMVAQYVPRRGPPSKPEMRSSRAIRIFPACSGNVVPGLGREKWQARGCGLKRGLAGLLRSQVPSGRWEWSREKRCISLSLRVDRSLPLGLFRPETGGHLVRGSAGQTT